MQYLENDVNSTALTPKKRTTTEEAPGTRLRCFGWAVQNGSSDYIHVSSNNFTRHHLITHTHRPVLTFIVVIRVFEDKDVIRPSPTPHCQHSKTEGKKKGKERERKNRKRALRRISLVIVVRQTNFWKLELIYPCWSAIVNEKQVFLCLFCCWWMVLNDPPRISVPTRKEV